MTQFSLRSQRAGRLSDDSADVRIIDDAPVTPNAIYVYDIRFESRRRGKDWRATFELRIDSNGNGMADESDSIATGAVVDVRFAEQHFS